MTRNEASILIAAILFTASPASAKWLDSGVLTDTSTWSHDYHFPKYSEAYSIVLEDKAPDELLREIEQAVLQEGGIIPQHLINAHPLPKGVAQTRFDLPQKGAGQFARSLLEKRDVKIFSAKTYADSGAVPAHNPQELYLKQEALGRACPEVRSQGPNGPALAAFCLQEKKYVEELIAAYELGQSKVRLLVAVTAPGVQYTPEPAPFSDETVWHRPGPDKDNPKEPVYWAASGEGHCSAKAEPIQITLSAKAAVAAAGSSEALIEKHGGQTLADDCNLPTRLQPGQLRERIAGTKDYAVPDKELASLPSLLGETGTIIYNGPLNTPMWTASTGRSAAKLKILRAGLADNPPVFKQVPAFKSLVEEAIQRLVGPAHAYETTAGCTPVHFVFMAAP